jgi:hypothetical protein
VGRVVLVFPTTHAAMAAEDALREVGIPLQVIPLPGWISAGCGLALRLDDHHVPGAEQELLRRGVRLRGVWEEPPAGN